MKFNDGYWLLKDGVEAIYAVDAVDARVTDRSWSIASLSKRHEHRGSHLNTPTITVEAETVAPGVIRVRSYHFAPTSVPEPQFVLDEGPRLDATSSPSPGGTPDPEAGARPSPDSSSKHAPEPNAARTNTQTNDQVTLAAGDLSALATTAGPWSMAFNRDGTPLLEAGSRSTGLMVVEGEPHMVQRFTVPVGTNVYGFGERFTTFVKNGQVVDTWNQDGGTASEQAYKAIPWLITDAGFGIFVNSPANVRFEVTSEVVSALQFSVEGECLEYYVIEGDSPKQILQRYTYLTGKPALPPRWSFGLWLSTSFTTDYDEATVTGYVDEMAAREIPLDVFHFDCYWMKPLQWCDFQWDEDSFPDPEGLLRRLNQRGIRSSAWVNPYVGQRSPVFQELADKGYLLKRPDGSVWQWDMWVAGMGIIDFTNPAARRWYGEQIRKLADQGVSAIKTDFGERIPTDVAWYDGSDPERMHNFYSYLYQETVFDALEDSRGAGEAVLFARSATIGCQKFPVHWGGDCESTFQAMAESLRAGLSLGLSGFGYWSHDVGGFEGTPSPDLFMRWLLFGLFSSHVRLHGSTSYRVPWQFGEKAAQVARDFTRLRNSMMPYFWAEAVATHRTGVPMMRPMVLEFPEDPTCAPLDRQYMLGSDLLVAPVFSEDGQVQFYLPGGTWTNFLTGRKYQGSRWYMETHDVDSIPLFVREGAVIPRGHVEDTADYSDLVAPTLEVFNLPAGEQTEVELFNNKGELATVFLVTNDGEMITAMVTEGADNLSAGWGLQLVSGPRGEDRGPMVDACPYEVAVSMPVLVGEWAVQG